MSNTKQPTAAYGINHEPGYDDDIDLRQLLGTLINGRFIIALVTASCVLLGLLFSELSTPIYKADALIQYEDSAPSIPGLDDMATMFSAESSSLAEIQIIKSRMVLGKVVDGLGLSVQVKPHYFPVIGAVLARRHMGLELADPVVGSSYAWGGEELTVVGLDVPRFMRGEELTLIARGDNQYEVYFSGDKILSGLVGQTAVNEAVGFSIEVARLVAHPGAGFAIYKMSRAQTILNLKADLRVLEKGSDTGIIEVSLEGSDVQSIAEIVDSVLANYYLQNIQRMAAEAERSLRFLEEQIPRVGDELLVAEDALNAYRLERSSIDLSLETRSALESLVQIEADISTMAINEADISRNFTAQHPNYIAFKRQQANLLSQRDKLAVKLEKLPDTQQKTLRLMRDFEVNQAIYIALQNRRQELSVIKAGTVGNVRVLDQAQVLPKPVSPKKGLIFVLAGLLGGMLGVFIVLVKTAFKQGVTNPKDFEDMGVPVHATIPVSEVERSFASGSKAGPEGTAGRNKKGFLLAKEYPAEITVEALRSLRTSLHFMMLNAENNVVMITSATPNAGKSFVSSNLALLLSAQTNKRVLLVDLDMRKGYVHRRYGQAPEKGMSDLLAGTLSLGDVVRKSQFENLDLVTRGAIPSNPSELLMGPMMGEFIKQVSADYDLVILDTPPILAVTDPSVIGSFAGTSLMVTRFEQCTTKQVERALHRFELSGVEIKGVVFNMIERRPSSYYYDTGYYHYEYSS